MPKIKSNMKGKNNPNYKSGIYAKNYIKYCKDCDKEIDRRSIRCYKCQGKTMKGKAHWNWTGNFPKCEDCGKTLSIKRNKNYIPKKCLKCYLKFNKGKNNGNYKDGRTKDKHYQAKYTRKRLKYDINFKLIRNLRIRLLKALKGKKKYNSTKKLIGCSIDFLKKHLENQFKTGMNWDNWGLGKNKWNIDHIKPCCAFDLSKTSEQKKCFHYTNLQPLWTEENQEKRKEDNKYKLIKQKLNFRP